MDKRFIDESGEFEASGSTVHYVGGCNGKIEGDIGFGAPLKIQTAWLPFKYYLDPTSNDTNPEFDESRNLFGDRFVD